MIPSIEQKHRRLWWAFASRGALALLVGMFIVGLPSDSLAALALLVPVWALLSGVTEMIHAYHVRAAFSAWWVLLLGGAISTAFGAAALYDYPSLSLAFLVAWVALWLLVSGTWGIYSSLHLKRSGLAWGWTCAWGILCVLASVMALVSPRATLAVILAGLAAFAIVSGTALLFAAWRIRGTARRIAAAHSSGPRPVL